MASRPATVQDAVEAIAVVRQSIAILCEPDHLNDTATLDRWLANKQPDSFVDWVSNPDNYCVVEEVSGKIVGVGLVHRSGELRLFYVAPGHERKGIGRSIHEALIFHAARWDLTTVYLESTSVARHFYESLGYRSAGMQKLLFGVLQAFPYVRPLQPDNSLERTRER